MMKFWCEDRRSSSVDSRWTLSLPHRLSPVCFILTLFVWFNPPSVTVCHYSLGTCWLPLIHYLSVCAQLLVFLRRWHAVFSALLFKCHTGNYFFFMKTQLLNMRVFKADKRLISVINLQIVLLIRSGIQLLYFTSLNLCCETMIVQHRQQAAVAVIWLDVNEQHNAVCFCNSQVFARSK